MKFEIPFNEDITRRQFKLKYDLTWNKTLKKHKTNLNVSIISVLLGSLIVYGNDNIGLIMVTIGFLGLYIYYRSNLIYRENKRKYENAFNDEIEKFKKSKENTIWEFHDDYFKYKDYKYDFKITWEGFNSYRIIEDNIFIDMNAESQLSYILAKEEIGEESFQTLIDFVDTKLKRINH